MIEFIQSVNVIHMETGNITLNLDTTTGNTLILVGSWASASGSPANLFGSVTDTASNDWIYPTAVGTPPADVQNPPAATNILEAGEYSYFGSFAAWCVNAGSVTGVTVQPAGDVGNWYADMALAEFSGIFSADSGSATQGQYEGENVGVVCNNPDDLIVIGMDSTQGGLTVPAPSGFTIFPSGDGFQSYLIGPGATGEISWNLSGAFSTGQYFTHASMSFTPLEFTAYMSSM